MFRVWGGFGRNVMGDEESLIDVEGSQATMIEL